METINKQLQIEPTNRNSNIRSRYARGANDYQVQLGTEDWSLDFYNDMQAIDNMSNANGWGLSSGERDLGKKMHSTKEQYDDFSGGYPICMTALCRKCKNDCKVTQGLHYRKDGGKECFKTCKVTEQEAQMDRIRGIQSGGSSESVKSGEIIPQDEQAPVGMSTGTKVGIALAGLVIVGLSVYMLTKRKK